MRSGNSGMGREKLFSVKLSDCEVTTFRAGGPGGQNQNKRDTAVRIKHPPSGAVVESREHRDQLSNKRAAMRKLAGSARFQMWAKTKALNLRPIAEIVDEAMALENLKVEVKEGGRWVESNTLNS